VLDVDPVGRMPLILANIRIDYLSPIFFNEPVEVGSQVDWVGNTSIAMSHLVKVAEGRDLARSSSVLVAYDYQQAHPMPVPDDWRQAFTAHEGRSLERPRGDA
jgi:acyl-CoA thioesterase FadM